MTNKRYATMFLRIGLVASLITALFWIIWSVFAPVPARETLKLSSTLKYVIPLSRWWGIGFAFLLVNAFAWAVRGCWLALKSRWSYEEFVAVLVIALVLSLVFGLGVSLVAVLVFGLGATIIYGLVFVLGVLIRYIFLHELWSRLYTWLSARNVQ